MIPLHTHPTFKKKKETPKTQKQLVSEHKYAGSVSGRLPLYLSDSYMQSEGRMNFKRRKAERLTLFAKLQASSLRNIASTAPSRRFLYGRFWRQSKIDIPNF